MDYLFVSYYSAFFHIKGKIVTRLFYVREESGGRVGVTELGYC
jgi:hypothetical protein